jgi:MacB-like periplasmic core domain/FtsX-like permease family
MAAVWARARAELHRRWGATVVLLVLAGLAGGVVLAAVAGARRTEGAMGRFLAYNQSMDVYVAGAGLDLDAVRRLPQVAAAGSRFYMFLAPPTPSGRPDPAALGDVNPWAPTLGPVWTTLDRPLLVAGRHPDPGRAFEVAVNERLASQHHLRPGSSFRMWAYTPEQVRRARGSTDLGSPAGPAFRFTVTGVERQPFDLSPVPVDTDVEYLGTENLYLTPAFWRQYRGAVGSASAPYVGLRLHRGERDFAVFSAAVRRLPGGRKALIGMGSDSERVAAEAQRAIHLQSIALLVFAALAALASLLVIGQGLARQVQLDAAEHPTLRAIGMTRWQLLAVELVRSSLIGVGGAALAAVLAVALSPLFPIGLARQAEIDPGWSVDPPVLVLGALAVLLLVLARTALAAWWVSRALSGPDAGQLAGQQASRVAEGLSRAGAPPSAVAGVRMALDPGRGSTAVPVRTALVGVTVAVAAIAASLTFATSLDRLVRSPALQGWNWDVVVGNPHGEADLSGAARPLLAANPLVEGFSSIAPASVPIRVGTLDVAVIGLDTVQGAVVPRFFEGREPRANDEIALGRTTLRRLGRHVGDVVGVGQGPGRRPMWIVGSVLLSPASFNGSDTQTTMGSGAVLTIGGLRTFAPDAVSNQLLVRYAPGADNQRAFRSLQRDFGRTVLRPGPPEDVANLHGVSGLPFLLAALLAVLGVATLGHALVTSARRRRRDLAVLKTLGFVRRQISSTLACQATTLTVIALLLGLPLGVATGRWAWLLVASGLESPAGPVTPTLAMLLAAMAAVLVANLVAVPPARSAARTRPAVVLRSE